MSDDAMVREVAEVLANIAHDSAESGEYDGEYDGDARDLIEWLVRSGWTAPNAKADA